MWPGSDIKYKDTPLAPVLFSRTWYGFRCAPSSPTTATHCGCLLGGTYVECARGLLHLRLSAWACSGIDTFINFIYISHIQAGIVAGENYSQRARQRWLATSCGVLVKSSEFLSSPLAIFLSTALSRRRIFLSSSQGTWSSSWRRAARQSPPPPPPPQPSPPTHTQPCPDISFTFFKCWC